MRPPERTRLAYRAVLPLTDATTKAKTPGPELSITGSPIVVPIRWDRSRRMAGSHCTAHPPPWSLPWVASWLHCVSASSLPRLQGGGGWTSGDGKYSYSWIPTSKALSVLLHGVLLNGSPPSSGSTGKNAGKNIL